MRSEICRAKQLPQGGSRGEEGCFLGLFGIFSGKFHWTSLIDGLYSSPVDVCNSERSIIVRDDDRHITVDISTLCV